MRAIRVPRNSAKEVIDRVIRLGVIDPERRIVEREGYVEVPVTRPVEGFETVEQRNPVPRDPSRTPQDRLRRSGVETHNWFRLGDLILAELGGDADAAEALLEAHPGSRAVVDLESIDGRLRRPEGRLLAGEGPTETTHREHGLLFRLDPLKVMFCPGNQAERNRYAEVTRKDDRVLDMFSCVGQFSVPAASTGAKVVAVDANPDAVHFLRINAELNGFENLHPVLGDSSRVAGDAVFDRILMGHLDSPGHLDEAARLVAPGGWIHYHEACPDAVQERPMDRVRQALKRRGREVDELELRRVKGFAPGVGHYVVDCKVDE